MNARSVLMGLLAAGIVLTACAPAPRAPVEPTEAPAGTPAEIPTENPTAAPTETPDEEPGSEPAMDPKNITYIIDGREVTLVDGVAETALAPGSATKQMTRYFGNEVEIDLNGDGLPDVAFLLTQDGGGSGTFFYVVAALKTTDGYVGTNAIFLGDRIAPQSTSVDLNNPAQFVVSYAERGPDEPMSSPPSQMASKTLKVEDGTLIEVLP